MGDRAWEKSGQETPNPLLDKGFSNDCHRLSERRARVSEISIPGNIRKEVFLSQNWTLCRFGVSSAPQ